jgi:hypothetical protein
MKRAGNNFHRKPRNMRYRSIDFDVEEVSPNKWRWKIFANNDSPDITGDREYLSRDAAIGGCIQKIDDEIKPSL